MALSSAPPVYSFIFDSSPLANHGVKTSNITYALPGKEGSCFTATAAGTIFTVPTGVFEPAYNEPWSVSFWWYGALPADGSFLCSRDSLFHHGIEVVCAAGTFYLGQFAVATSGNYWRTTMANPTLSAGTWHNIVATYNGTGTGPCGKLYIDGVDMSIGSSAFTLSSNPTYGTQVYVGQRGASGTALLPAGSKMDMLTMWKGRKLTAGEAAAIYANPTSAYIIANLGTNLTALYAMDQWE